MTTPIEQVYQLALERLVMQKEEAEAETRRVTAEAESNQKQWLLLDKQYTDIITVLNDRMVATDKESEERTKKTSLIVGGLRKRAQERDREDKAMKKLIRGMKKHIRRSNDLLDDIIRDGDALVDES